MQSIPARVEASTDSNRPRTVLQSNRTLEAKMTSRERILTALNLGIPDRVPYMELAVDRALAQRLLNRSGSLTQKANLEQNVFSLSDSVAVADHLHQDNLGYVLRAPVYAEKHEGKDGRLFYGKGLLNTKDDIAMIDLPDPHDDRLYEEAQAFAAGKGGRAACFVTRAGIFPVLLGMGVEGFSIALYENIDLIKELLEIYFAWSETVAERACSLGFDVYVSTDDMAFKTGPYFSPAVFHEVVLPFYRRLAEKITLPWIIHSDGNILPFLDDLLSLGIAGIHPLEKGAVDIRAIKKIYGNRVCLLGNVDLNLLGSGAPDKVEDEVKWLLREIAPGGGYILTSGNSLAGYCIPENVMAMVETMASYGAYPITIPE